MQITNEIQTEQPLENIVMTPNNPPWNGWVALGVWVLSVVFVVIVPLCFVGPYVIQRGVNFQDKVQLNGFLRTDPTAVILQLAPLILAHALTLLVAWFVVTKFRKYSFREILGWNMDGFRIWHGVVITLLFFVVGAVLTKIFGEVENDFDAMLHSSRAAVYLVAFFATFTAPVVEEVIYRGLLYSAFQRRFGAALGVILVTLLFTAVHVPQYSLGATPDFATITALLLLSLTLTGLRAWTGNLLPCIVLHTVFNGIQSLVLILEPYLRSVQPAIEPTTSFILK